MVSANSIQDVNEAKTFVTVLCSSLLSKSDLDAFSQETEPHRILRLANNLYNNIIASPDLVIPFSFPPTQLYTNILNQIVSVMSSNSNLAKSALQNNTFSTLVTFLVDKKVITSEHATELLQDSYRVGRTVLSCILQTAYPSIRKHILSIKNSVVRQSVTRALEVANTVPHLAQLTSALSKCSTRSVVTKVENKLLRTVGRYEHVCGESWSEDLRHVVAVFLQVKTVFGNKIHDFLIDTSNS